MIKSYNNRLVVQAYKKEALRSTEKNGFAFVDQKLSLKGLKVLADGVLSNGWVNVGSTAYIKEELLHSQPWAQKSYQCESIGEPFMIVDIAHVEFIEDPPAKEE